MSYKALASRMAVVLTDRIKAELMTCHDIVASGRYPYTGKLGILTSDDEQKVEEALAMVHAGELGMPGFREYQRWTAAAGAACQSDLSRAGCDDFGRADFLFGCEI